MPREDRVIAATLGLSAFSVAIIAGALADNDATTVMFRAVLAMLACYILGLALGAVFKHLLAAHVAEHTRTHPIPDVSALGRPRHNPPAAAVEKKN